MTWATPLWVYNSDGHCGTKIDSDPNHNITQPITEPRDSDSRMESTLATYHASNQHEKLVLGVYVDNLQIVHSSRIDDKGSKVHAFMEAIQAEWDVEDEGQMDDLLGIEIKYNSDGSITFHQQTYIDIEKVVAEFLPRGI